MVLVIGMAQVGSCPPGFLGIAGEGAQVWMIDARPSLPLDLHLLT